MENNFASFCSLVSDLENLKSDNPSDYEDTYDAGLWKVCDDASIISKDYDFADKCEHCVFGRAYKVCYEVEEYTAIVSKDRPTVDDWKALIKKLNEIIEIYENQEM